MNVNTRSSSASNRFGGNGSIALADVRGINLPSMQDYIKRSSSLSSTSTPPLCRATDKSLVGSSFSVPEFVAGAAPSPSDPIRPTKIPNFSADGAGPETTPRAVSALKKAAPSSSSSSQLYSSEFVEPAADSPASASVGMTNMTSSSSRRVPAGVASRSLSGNNNNNLPPFVPPGATTMASASSSAPGSVEVSPVRGSGNKNTALGNIAANGVDEHFIEEHLQSVQRYYEGRLQEMERELLRQREINNSLANSSMQSNSNGGGGVSGVVAHSAPRSLGGGLQSVEEVYHQPEKQNRLYSVGSATTNWSANSARASPQPSTVAALNQPQRPQQAEPQFQNYGHSGVDIVVRRKGSSHQPDMFEIPGEGVSLEQLEANSSSSFGHPPLLPTKTKATTESLTPLMDAFQQRLHHQHQPPRGGSSASSNNSSSTAGGSGIVKLNLFGAMNNKSASNDRATAAVAAGGGRSSTDSVMNNNVAVKGGVLADRRGGVASPGRDRLQMQQKQQQQQLFPTLGGNSNSLFGSKREDSSEPQPDAYAPSPPRRRQPEENEEQFVSAAPQYNIPSPTFSTKFATGSNRTRSNTGAAANGGGGGGGGGGPALSAPLRPSSSSHIDAEEIETVPLAFQSSATSASFGPTPSWNQQQQQQRQGSANRESTVAPRPGHPTAVVRPSVASGNSSTVSDDLLDLL